MISTRVSTRSTNRAMRNKHSLSVKGAMKTADTSERAKTRATTRSTTKLEETKLSKRSRPKATEAEWPSRKYKMDKGPRLVRRIKSKASVRVRDDDEDRSEEDEQLHENGVEEKTTAVARVVVEEEDEEAPVVKKAKAYSAQPATKALLKNVDMNKEELFVSGIIMQENDEIVSSLETELWLQNVIIDQVQMLELEIIEIDYAERLNPQVPNNTLTHMVRNANNLYRDMPTGRNYRMLIPLDQAKPVSLVTVEVIANEARWFHRPNRMYGPFGEIGGAWEPMSEPPCDGIVRLVFKDRAAYKRFGLHPPPPPQFIKIPISIKAQPTRRRPKTIDTGVRTIPMVLIDAALDQSCTCLQENPKQPSSKSYDFYEDYKHGSTLRELLKLGARKADLSNDIARGYIVLTDPLAQQDLVAKAQQAEARGRRRLPPPSQDFFENELNQAEKTENTAKRRHITEEDTLPTDQTRLISHRQKKHKQVVKKFKRGQNQDENDHSDFKKIKQTKAIDDEEEDNDKSNWTNKFSSSSEIPLSARRPRRRATSTRPRYSEDIEYEDEDEASLDSFDHDDEGATDS